MKQLLYILFLTLHLNNVFANDYIEYPSLEPLSNLEPLSKAHLDTPITTDKYTYFTLGSSVLFQQVGIGQRYRNLETFKGHDISLNTYFSLPLSSNAKHFKHLIFPYVKYTYLKYKNNSPTSSYFGVACEGIFDVQNSRSVIPNLALIWGKEKENMRFTQLQVNVIPVVGLAVGTGLLLFGSNKRGHMIPLSERDVGVVMALGSASIVCSYSAGF